MKLFPGTQAGTDWYPAAQAKKLFSSLSKKQLFGLLFLLFLLLTTAAAVYLAGQKILYQKKAAEPIPQKTIEDFMNIQVLNINKPIYSFKISGKVNLQRTNSYVRAILIDNSKNEYLVYETYPLLVDSNNFSVDKVCEETCILDGVAPVSLRIEGNSSGFELTNTSYPEKIEELKLQANTNLEAERLRIKEEKDKQKIIKLKEQIPKKGMKWSPGKTSISKMSYQEKKKLFSKPDGKPVDHLPNLQGFEYYLGGIFEVPSSTSLSMTTSSSYSREWDWRNKHGQNWLTSIKNQGGCGSCWAFATAGTTEANANLYFNGHLNLDLSEQELLSCSRAGSCNGGYPELALQHIQNSGIVDETCFPYQSNQTSCQVCTDGENRRVKIGGFNTNIYTNEDLLKFDLINKGVLSSGIYSWGHTMPLVGWQTETDNSTVWIFKNSWGANWGENGYARIRMSLSDMYPTNSINLPIFISNQNQQINCTDNDGDDYCYWGLSQNKPNTCSTFCNAIKDCDDSNPNLQIPDQYYNCFSVNNTTPTPIPLPASGRAVYLDGNTTITVLDSDKKLVMTPQFTLETWLKPVYRSNYFWASIIRKDVDYGGGFDIGLESYKNDPQKRLFLRFAHGGSQTWYDVVLPDNQWSHLAVVRNGTEINFFINGILVKSSQLTTVDIIPTNFSNLYLGIGTMRVPLMEKPMFAGSLDELRISNIVRDVSSNWQRGIYFNPLGLDSGTVSLWRFDSNLLDSGSYKKDASGRGNIQYVEGRVVTPSIPPPDLKVKNLEFSPTAPITGQTVKVNADVYNDSQGDVHDSFLVGLFVKSGEGFSKDWQKIAETKIGGLKKGESRAVSFEWSPTSPGKYDLQVWADSNQEIPEEDESNNQETKSLEVSSSKSFLPFKLPKF